MQEMIRKSLLSFSQFTHNVFRLTRVFSCWLTWARTIPVRLSLVSQIEWCVRIDGWTPGRWGYVSHLSFSLISLVCCSLLCSFFFVAPSNMTLYDSNSQNLWYRLISYGLETLLRHESWCDACSRLLLRFGNLSFLVCWLQASSDEVISGNFVQMDAWSFDGQVRILHGSCVGMHVQCWSICTCLQTTETLVQAFTSSALSFIFLQYCHVLYSVSVGTAFAFWDSWLISFSFSWGKKLRRTCPSLSLCARLVPYPWRSPPVLIRCWWYRSRVVSMSPWTAVTGRTDIEQRGARSFAVALCA